MQAEYHIDRIAFLRIARCSQIASWTSPCGASVYVIGVLSEESEFRSPGQARIFRAGTVASAVHCAHRIVDRLVIPVVAARHNVGITVARRTSGPAGTGLSPERRVEITAGVLLCECLRLHGTHGGIDRRRP